MVLPIPLVVAAAVVAGLVLLYQFLLPQPIPGIAYKSNSARSLLGDLPRFLRYVKKHQDPFAWIANQCLELQSPIVQVWLKPFHRPSIILGDFHETEDILVRRTKEFDRAPFFQDVLVGILPLATTGMLTDDVFKHQRRAFIDTMSPAFINGTAGPSLRKSTIELIKLWHTKSLVAKEHPFAAEADISNTVFDAIWASTFGYQPGTIQAQNDKLRAVMPPMRNADDKDKPVSFPDAELPAISVAATSLSHSIGDVIPSPIPRVHHRILLSLPKLRSATKTKNRAIEDAICAARERFNTSNEENDSNIKSALDLVLRRQAQAAVKGEEILSEAALSDELFAFLIAGHDTTAANLCWVLKWLSTHQEVQSRLRSDLVGAYSVAASSTSGIIAPSSKAIMENAVPYLDAVIEEFLRCSVGCGITRVATVDTTVLGHFIPKGTEIHFPNNGPSIMSPPIPSDGDARTDKSHSFRTKTKEWDPVSIRNFNPDRWLEKDEEGKVVFNLKAGPNYPFSMGLRGCFGKRLAYAQLRMVIVLIVLNFHLQSLPAELETYGVKHSLTRAPRLCYVRLGEL